MMIFAMNKGLSSVMNLLQYQAFRGSSESFLLCWRAGKQGIKLLHGNLACSSLHHTPDNTPHHMTQKPVCSEDRKSTRLNSSHVAISYAVFCLKKKNTSAVLEVHAAYDADRAR